jgi:hypothetical protein
MPAASDADASLTDPESSTFVAIAGPASHEVVTAEHGAAQRADDEPDRTTEERPYRPDDQCSGRRVVVT